MLLKLMFQISSGIACARKRPAAARLSSGGKAILACDIVQGAARLFDGHNVLCGDASGWLEA